MAESVKKYGGFYVGRYETSLKGERVQSKKDENSATAAINSANTWYGLYKIQKTYVTTSVRSSMIWGSQYDAMMGWIGEAAKTNIGNNKNGGIATGTKKEDVIKNVYDLYGCHHEWTLEAQYGWSRVPRGGDNDDSYSLDNRLPNHNPTNTSKQIGSRITLYVL